MTAQGRTLSDRLPRTPFWSLVAHFTKRILAGDDEQAGESMSLSLGAVLALLASPGAFVSILLIDKYSPLLVWLRGQRHFDPYRASASDEYFFVVLSMTITGLVMVLRWDRLFPDRRDFANLAVLPIPIRSVFIANLTALLGLGLLFGIDVNAASSFLFPLFVTMVHGTLSSFLHLAISHAAAVFSASLFSFFGVFAFLGVLMLVLPKRLFRTVSLFCRMLLVVGLLSGFFSNVFFGLLTGRSASHPGEYARLFPPLWFLGLYENVLGTAKPVMAQLGQQALIALVVAIVISVLAYSLVYRRQFLRLPESLDVAGGARRRFRLPIPRWTQRLLFRSPFEHACMSFVLRVLFRSERHLMFFGGYLGICLVLVAQNFTGSAAAESGTSLPSADMLAVPLLIAFFLITGLRLVFDIPAVLSANWLFRLAIEKAEPSPAAIMRRLMLWMSLSWEIVLLVPLTAHRYGWTVAALHGATIAILSVLLIDLVLINFRKIPFTCSREMDVKRLIFRVLGLVLAVAFAVPAIAGIESWMLEAARSLYLGRRFRRYLLGHSSALQTPIDG